MRNASSVTLLRIRLHVTETFTITKHKITAAAIYLRYLERNDVISVFVIPIIIRAIY